MNPRSFIATLLIGCSISLLGCTRNLYDPEQATRPYPHELHTTNVADMHVFRRGTSIEIVNSTAHSYNDFYLWINQRYVRHVDALSAGETITLSLWDFRDEFGDAFNAGGFFRTYPATPVRLVQIQPAEGEQLLGLVTIRAEDIILPAERRR